MITDVDVYVGKRLRRRRRLLGLTQQNLADAIGVRFQQIQKYECSGNRVTAARLYQIANVLKVPTTYFFEGLADPGAQDAMPVNEVISSDVLTRRETIELIRAYYQLGERPRRKLLDLAKALREEEVVSAA